MVRDKKLRHRLIRRYKTALKYLYQTFFVARDHEQVVCFILGCQRSGTTLMVRVFDNDMRLRAYPELSAVTFENFRQRPHKQVIAIIEASNAPIVIMKPLVESQCATRLLREYRKSKCIWMYRHYKDVVASILAKFGHRSAINDIRHVVERDATKWIGENISEHCHQLVNRFYTANISPYTAAALIWYIRNRLFFEQQLDRDNRVILCRYEDLVQHPSETMHTLYNHIGAKFPGEKVVNEIDSTSLGKGSNISLSKDVRDVCQDLYDRLASAQLSQ